MSVLDCPKETESCSKRNLSAPDGEPRAAAPGQFQKKDLPAPTCAASPYCGCPPDSGYRRCRPGAECRRSVAASPSGLYPGSLRLARGRDWDGRSEERRVGKEC